MNSAHKDSDPLHGGRYERGSCLKNRCIDYQPNDKYPLLNSPMMNDVGGGGHSNAEMPDG